MLTCDADYGLSYALSHWQKHLSSLLLKSHFNHIRSADVNSNRLSLDFLDDAGIATDKQKATTARHFLE